MHEIPGTGWVLARLSSYFGEMMEVKCKHRRYGSLVFHKNCDLLNAISLALGRSCAGQKDAHRISANTAKQQTSNSIEEQIAVVANHLNDRVQQQIKTLIGSHSDIWRFFEDKNRFLEIVVSR